MRLCFTPTKRRKSASGLTAKTFSKKTILTPIVDNTVEYTITSGPFENVVFIEGLLDNNNELDNISYQNSIVTDGGYSSPTSKRYDVEKKPAENNSIVTAHIGGISFDEGDTYNLYTTIRYTKY